MNEYKVGDHLVAKRKFKSNELFKVERIGWAGNVFDSNWRLLHTIYLEPATEKEIKAGRRL